MNKKAVSRLLLRILCGAVVLLLFSLFSRERLLGKLQILVPVFSPAVP